MKIGVILSTIFVVLFLTACNSFKLGNILETTALAGVGYATGGIAPAVAVGVTSMVANELKPEDSIPEIQNATQALSYVTVEAFMWLVYFGIAYIILRDIVIPLVNQLMRFRRENQDKKHKKEIK